MCAHQEPSQAKRQERGRGAAKRKENRVLPPRDPGESRDQEGRVQGGSSRGARVLELSSPRSHEPGVHQEFPRR